ncbi:hypothetical protein [Flavobacterium araucananum]|uniref:hypothetical protein n=1 Tax=Flavobacterium araucananum TaxID=946678 RepID=UPI000F50C692|nr:hypothetical protein [Flavobacterium araucananum]
MSDIISAFRTDYPFERMKFCPLEKSPASYQFECSVFVFTSYKNDFPSPDSSGILLFFFFRKIKDIPNGWK